MEENHGNKINWMYEGKNSSIDHEQYLLGKRITSISNDDDEDKGDFLVKPESSVATGNVTVLERLDYESKVREDPLFQIRKNDYEHRKELLSNPLKKKRIQNMLKEALERDLRRSGTKGFSDSSSDESSSSSSSSENEKRRHKHQSKYHRQKYDESLHKHSKHDQHHKKSYTKDKTEGRHSKSSERDKERDRPHSHQKPDGFGLICLQDGKHVSTTAKKRRQRTPSPEKPKDRYQRVNRSGFSRRLTKEELEKKRKEMMSNASWRDNQRKDNVKKFKMDDAREEEKERRQQLDRQKDKYGHSRDFLQKMKLKTASSGSVEDSVRRKKHTLSHKI